MVLFINKWEQVLRSFWMRSYSYAGVQLAAVEFIRRFGCVRVGVIARYLPDYAPLSERKCTRERRVLKNVNVNKKYSKIGPVS